MRADDPGGARPGSALMPKAGPRGRHRVSVSQGSVPAWPQGVLLRSTSSTYCCAEARAGAPLALGLGLRPVGGRNDTVRSSSGAHFWV